jgi:hypothetical protein
MDNALRAVRVANRASGAERIEAPAVLLDLGLARECVTVGEEALMGTAKRKSPSPKTKAKGRKKKFQDRLLDWYHCGFNGRFCAPVFCERKRSCGQGSPGGLRLLLNRFCGFGCSLLHRHFSRFESVTG